MNSTLMPFTVISAAGTLSLVGGEGVQLSSEKYSLVLRVSSSSDIVLSTGERLGDVDIHLLLSPMYKIAKEIDEDLTIEDIGFIVHVEESGVPFIHGTALLQDSTVVASLLSKGTRGSGILFICEGNSKQFKPPFVWGKYRQNMLHIRSLEICVTQAKESA